MPAHNGRNCPRSEGKNTSSQQNQGLANHLERWKLEKISGFKLVGATAKQFNKQHAATGSPKTQHDHGSHSAMSEGQEKICSKPSALTCDVKKPRIIPKKLAAVKTLMHLLSKGYISSTLSMHLKVASTATIPTDLKGVRRLVNLRPPEL